MASESVEIMRRLSERLSDREIELRQLHDKGAKIVGYVPNGYMPEELVYACGAVPVPLIRGGDLQPVVASLRCLGKVLDPFCRAQVGYRILKQEPLYQILDLLIVPVTDNHVRAIADSWDFVTDVEVFRFGVPHAKTSHGLTYYLEGLHSVKEKLEEFTGIDITDLGLKEEIRLSNGRRHWLKKISLERKSDPPALSGEDFIRLNQSCFFADRRCINETLELFYKDLKERQAWNLKGPRIFLAGSTLALGDSKVVRLIERMGAPVVIEEFCEGLQNYWENVNGDSDPVGALADCYFRRRIPGAYFRGSAAERFEFFVRLIEEFEVKGVIWYSLMYRDAYDVEGYLFHNALKKLNIPFLKISSGYDEMETSALETRIETFIQTIA